MKQLYILDLDNTLIYATAGALLPARELLHYSGLVIYERPHAKEFVQQCHSRGDVMVFTTAIRPYAEQVCSHLGMVPLKIFSREECTVIHDRYIKSIPDKYFRQYESITIFDDMPQVWDLKSHIKCNIIGVTPFMGYEDDELIRLLE